MGGGTLARRGHSIPAIRALAKRRLPRAVFDFTDGAAEDEVTLRRNEDAFDAIALLPRPLRGAAERDLSITLFGRRLALPVIVGPTALSGLVWPDGEACAARAAAAAGTAFCLSHGSSVSMEELAATGAEPRWMQVFVYRDRSFTYELAERAAAAGYDGLVLTVDNQVPGSRERDLRNGFTIPPRLGPAEIAGLAMKPGWIWRMRHKLPGIGFGNYVRNGKRMTFQSREMRVTALLDPGMTWKDVDDLRARWPGRLIVKGILHPDEARQAPEHGVDGLVVSNHGGRQLDGAAATIEALPAVVEAVAGRIPVMIDGGVRRGVDVVRALALGATACLIGRPQLWGLAAGGEAGVRRVLDIYRSEIDRVMGLCGVSRIADIGPDILLPRRP